MPGKNINQPKLLAEVILEPPQKSKKQKYIAKTYINDQYEALTTIRACKHLIKHLNENMQKFPKSDREDDSILKLGLEIEEELAKLEDPEEIAQKFKDIKNILSGC